MIRWLFWQLERAAHALAPDWLKRWFAWHRLGRL